MDYHNFYKYFRANHLWQTLRDLLGIRISYNDTRVGYVLNRDFLRGALQSAVDPVLKARKAREQRMLSRVASWNM